MTTSHLNERFASLRDALPGSRAVLAQRVDALARLASLGLPTRKIERWRYTDLSHLDLEAYDWSAPPPRAADGTNGLEQRIIRTTGPRFVLVDGHLSSSLSRMNVEPSLEIGGLDRALDADGNPSRTQRLDSHPLALLNTAFVRDGLLIRVPAGCRVTRPLVIALLGSPSVRAAVQPRLVLELGAGAELEVVVQLTDDATCASWVNVVTEVRQQRASRLTLTRIQDHGPLLTHTSLTTATLARDATLALRCFELGGHLVRHDVSVSLDEPGARLDLDGSFLALGEQHVDQQLLVEHRACETVSRQQVRGIAGDRGRGIFGGKVVVHEDAQRIDARQRSDNLLLSKTAEIDTTPALEIYADDVKCSHGATVGELDPRHLFYLQSRGVGSEAARALLTFAFANASLDAIDDGELHRHLSERIAQRLPAHERWERLVS